MHSQIKWRLKVMPPPMLKLTWIYLSSIYPCGDEFRFYVLFRLNSTNNIPAITKIPIATPIRIGCDDEFDGSDGMGFVDVPTVMSKVSDFTTVPVIPVVTSSSYACLLYTSDAADEEDSVDLGGW